MEKIGIIGLGYVGLPLAVEFGKVTPVVGFDINKERISELQKGYDRTLEVEKEDLQASKQLTYSADINDLKSVKYFIV
ncbi:MAG: Vi polysaccharide biosynthesis UDP-N-acetylglucosamine C-6 dehydrogenase TviB, partial [Chryseotalea sp.]